MLMSARDWRRQVECTSCGAPAGHSCRTRSGGRASTEHVARWDASPVVGRLLPPAGGHVGRTDAEVLSFLTANPEWLTEKVLARLSGYPAPNACWEFPVKTRGYGNVTLPSSAKLRGKRVSARTHRVVWLAINGAIPSGHVLDHDGPNGCGNRACANPLHLSVATIRENTLDTGSGVTALAARRTHCPQGHPLRPGNLVAAELRRGFRSCLTCSRASTSRWNARKSASSSKSGAGRGGG